ncbi:MAG: ATP-binding protein [Muribaculaceae bacterium]|nr:ATP-binding protein [Muribaculaceae bacterium]
MIRGFWVKNYLSIRDKQELSFVAKGPSSELVTEAADGVFLYKLGILYGANASGKSNMLIAMNEAFRLLVMPQSDATVGIDGFIPFILTKDEPTEMHVSFYADGTRYDYDVKFNDTHILSEALYYYPNKSKSLFYERSFVGENVQADIKFGASLKLQVKTQESIRENTLNNHSVLAVCRKAALKEDIAPFNVLHAWIMANYHDVDGDVEKGLVETLKDAYSNSKKRKFYNMMLKKADLNILEYRPVMEDRFVPNDFRERIQKENIPEEVKDILLKPTANSISFLNHSDNGDFDIPLRWQSKGTRKYIRILDALYDLITSPHVYYLDELGEDLHNDLLYYYLNVFIFNSDKSQLIITSQETTLLSQDMINENRGVVWFVEKNKETASSEYARGDSFGLHKNLSLYNSYRIGRLGAKPELGSIFINLED